MAGFLACLLLYTNWSWAQSNYDPYYAVILKDSSVIRGRLLNYEYGEKVIVRLGSGRILNIEAYHLDRIMPYRDYKAKYRKRKPARSYSFRERGWFGDVAVATYHGGTLGEPVLGGGVSGVIGLRWNRWLETGIGVGYERYTLNDFFRVVPVFARIRGYMLTRKVSPFYQLEAGYGKSLKKRSEAIIEGGGGALVHPSIGLRLGGSSGLNTYLDLGYRFQWASYTQEEVWDAVTKQDLVFQRLTFRFGLVF